MWFRFLNTHTRRHAPILKKGREREGTSWEGWWAVVVVGARLFLYTNYYILLLLLTTTLTLRTLCLSEEMRWWLDDSEFKGDG